MDDTGASSSGKRKRASTDDKPAKKKTTKKISSCVGSLKDLKLLRDSHLQRTISIPNNALTAQIFGSRPKVPSERECTVNELDVLNNRQRSCGYYNWPLSCAFFGRLGSVRRKRDAPVAGPSSDKRKRAAKPKSGAEAEILDELRSLAECLLQNALNVLEINETSLWMDNRWLVQSTALRIEDVDSDDASWAAPPPPSPAGASAEKIDDASSSASRATVANSSYDADVSSEGSGSIDAARRDVERASREALYDPGSALDLGEFAPVALLADAGSVRTVAVAEPIFVPGNAEQNDDFPDWLLQILGANIINEEDNNAQDEAHFYCQGDGLGVHPSVLTAGADDDNIDDDDDDDTSTSTSSLTSSLTSPSTRGTANIAETGVENSELDALSIPFDNPSSMATENDRNVIHDNSSGEEESSEKQLTLSDIIVTNFLSAHSDSNNSQNTVVDMSSLSSYAVKPQQLTLADSEEYFDSNDDVS